MAAPRVCAGEMGNNSSSSNSDNNNSNIRSQHAAHTSHPLIPRPLRLLHPFALLLLGPPLWRLSSPCPNRVCWPPAPRSWVATFAAAPARLLLAVSLVWNVEPNDDNDPRPVQHLHGHSSTRADQGPTDKADSDAPLVADAEDQGAAINHQSGGDSRKSCEKRKVATLPSNQVDLTGDSDTDQTRTVWPSLPSTIELLRCCRVNGRDARPSHCDPETAGEEKKEKQDRTCE